MEYKLADLFDLQMGKTPSRNDIKCWDKGVYNWISIADLSNCGQYIHETKEKISDYAVKVSGIKVIPANTVIMSFKLSIGKVAITSRPIYSNEAIMAFINKGKIYINPEYLYYLLLHKNWEDGSNKAVMGKTLNKSNLSQVKIKIDSSKYQDEIVKKLNLVNQIITDRKKQLKSLDELVKSRFVEMFGSVKTNSMNWPIVEIGNIIEKLEAGWSGSGQQRDKKSGEIAVLKVSSVTQGYFIPEECKVLDNQKNIKKYIFPQKGDLLFSRANTREMVGATAIIMMDYPELILPDKLWKIQFKDNANVFYMKQVLSSTCIRKRFSAVSTGTSGSMYNVSMDKFKKIDIPLPPVNLQEKFAEFIIDIHKSRLAIQKSLDETQLLFDSLMQKYFG